MSAKTFMRKGQPASQLGDYLRACGRKGKLSGDANDQKDAVEATAGQVYRAYGDWQVYQSGVPESTPAPWKSANDGRGIIIEGMENFPKGENGEPSPFVLSPNLLDDEGQPKKLRANFRITRFIPAP